MGGTGGGGFTMVAEGGGCANVLVGAGVVVVVGVGGTGSTAEVVGGLGEGGGPLGAGP